MASDDSTGGKAGDKGLLGFALRRRKEPESGPSDEAAQAASRELVDQAAAFKSLRVSDVMTPRADIVAVELATPLSEVVAAFIESEHSRMPIYREQLDDPIGVVHIKDVFKMTADLSRRPGADEAVLGRLRREMLYVPPSMPASALLAKMQASRLHMAIVVDEFGGADGLVTMEDLIEPLVGEIDDEHDETSRARVLARGPGVFEADARAALEDLETCVGEALAPPDLEEEIDTVGGLVAALAGRVPQRGEVITHPIGFDFEILDADPRRIRRVKVRDIRETEPEAPPA